MTKRLRAKGKIERRYGAIFWDQKSSPVKVRSYASGQHGTKPKRKGTEYKAQLSSKQKLKGIYGDISERQFHSLFKEAQNSRGHTGENLITYLEMRLDSCVYRAKWVPTPFMARQLVNHNHVRVNGKKVNIRSYRLRVGDVVTLDEKMQRNATVMTASDSSNRDVPGYMDVKGFEAKIVRLPDIQEVPYPFQVDTQSIIEYYSR
jgi:small subunit ribosomal protein S4